MNRLGGLESLITMRDGFSEREPHNLHWEAEVKGYNISVEYFKGKVEEDKIRYHQVLPGEMLYSISLKYGIKLRSYEGLKTSSPKQSYLLTRNLL
jgi:hypothetical protein